ncbi:MAG: hypothetical protein DWP98_13360 [Bacteroidetes bacterium]|nr:MAG: hypothetical protein DWP98_13360 [Bacteroidota bacterium]MBL1143551.1 hypothetical protein [Bacteroidota bacterium]NOG56353.1 hypothetical protein [Bacteroidota bacterium]
MDSNSKRKEINALIDNIKQHSDRLSDVKTIPMLELSVILSKINRLHETTVILKYLIAQEQGWEAEEFSSDILFKAKQKARPSEERSLDAEAQVQSMNESDDQDEIYVEMEVDESDVKSIDLEDDEEIFIEMEVESDEDEEDYIHGDSQEDEDLNEENQINIEVEETIVSTIDGADEEVVNEIIKNLEDENIGNLPDINEQYAEADASLGDQLQKQPITDLVSAIGLNERYFYANELFDGDLDEFKNELNTLNTFDNREDALKHFNNLANKHNWNKSSEMSKALHLLVERRFL